MIAEVGRRDPVAAGREADGGAASAVEFARQRRVQLDGIRAMAVLRESRPRDVPAEVIVVVAERAPHDADPRGAGAFPGRAGERPVGPFLRRGRAVEAVGAERAALMADVDRQAVGGLAAHQGATLGEIAIEHEPAAAAAPAGDGPVLRE